MSEVSFQIEVPTIDLSDVNTDEEFRNAATLVMPDVLRRGGELIGEHTWNEMRKALKNPLIKMNDSLSDRRKFIREFADDFAKGLSDQERESIIVDVIEALKREKANAEGDADESSSDT